MYNLKYNNYNKNPKNSTIYTPPAVSRFIFELLRDKLEWKWDKNKTCRGVIFDPCCGQGSLLKPWHVADSRFCFGTFGIDIDKEARSKIVANFLTLTREEIKEFLWPQHPILVICNPPFNGYKGKLGSEVWLDQIIARFGKEIPIVLFVPMGFRLDGQHNQKYPSISSIISLPLDIFPEVEFHSEILIFNLPNLSPHYFFNHPI